MLSLTNVQASLHDPFVRDVASYLSQRINHSIQFIGMPTWQAREQQLDAGKIDMGWICGAPYVFKIAGGIPLQLLAAPVMAQSRYQNHPVYFSDVIVHADSPFTTFADLRGTRWAYNEPHSHSGYHVVRYFLATRGLDGKFFGSVCASEAHYRSVELILSGEIDSSAIDSTVLEMMLARDPALANQLRIIETIGPSPMPPLVIGAHISDDLFSQIQNALMTMHESDQGREILASAQMARIVPVTDGDYDPIRNMLEIAREIYL